MKLTMADAWVYVSETNFVPQVIKNVLQYEWNDEKTGKKIIKSLFIDEEQKFPAGAWYAVNRVLTRYNIFFTFEDKTLYPTGQDEIENSIHLRDYQEEAEVSFMKGDNEFAAKFRGICSIATGGGKTVYASKIMASINLPTIFFVHTKDLFIQTKRNLVEFFGSRLIGSAGGGEDDFKNSDGTYKQIIVTMIQALYYHGRKKGFMVKPMYQEILNRSKVMICDECLVSGTDILNHEGIPYLIEYIKDGEESLVGGKISNTFNRKTESTIIINHRLNTIETSPTHTNMVVKNISDQNVEKIQSKDLKDDYLLLTPSCVKHEIDKDNELTYNQLRFIATIMCDGHLELKRNMIKVSVSKDKEWFTEIFKEGLRDFGVLHKFNEIENSRGDLVLSIEDKKIRDYFEGILEIQSGKKSNIIYISKYIWSNSLDNLRGFIDGVFCCEGDVSCNRVTVVSTTSKRFANHIQLLLLKFGIISTIRTKKRSNPLHKICFMVSITGGEIRKFKDNFSISMQRKRYMISELSEKCRESKFKYIIYNGEKYILSKIKSIILSNESKTVYDFTTESHVFIANNTLTHNCHHGSSDSWFWVAQACPAPYRLGLTATPWRADGRDLLLQAATGPVIAKISSRELVERGWLSKPLIKMYNINVVLDPRFEETTWHNVYKAGIVFNDHRNIVIAQAVVKRMMDNKSILVIIGHKIHGFILWQMISTIVAQLKIDGRININDDTMNAMVMNSEFDIDSRRSALNLFRNGRLKCLIGSLHPEEPIWIRDKTTKEISITNIGDFVESFVMKKLGTYKEQIACEYNNEDVLNLDGSAKFEAYTEYEDGTTGWEDITNVIRHKNENSVQEIRLKNGMFTKITDNHSIINENHQPIKPEVGKNVKTSLFEICGDQTEIDIADVILNSSLTDEEKNTFEVEFYGLDRQFIYRIQRLRKGTFHQPERPDKVKTYKRLMPEWIEEPENIKEFQEEFDKYVWYEKGKYRCNLCSINKTKYLKNLPCEVFVRRSKHNIRLPLKLKITKELATILGAFAAEGCLCKSTVSQYIVTWSCREDCVFDKRIGFSEKTQIRDFLKEDLVSVFGEKPYEDILGIYYRSKLIYALFDGLKTVRTKESKAQKQVPHFIWNCDKEIQRMFLWGYFLGDGSNDIINKRIVFTSCSYNLLCGIRQLLINLGCRAIKLKHRTKCENQVQRSWNLCIKDDPFGYWKDNTSHTKTYIQKRLTEISKINYLDDQPKYVYDISVRKTEKFYSLSSLELKNTSIYDEGVDLPSVNTVIMAAGGKSDTKVIQRLGRSLRLGDRCLFITASNNCTLLTTDDSNPFRCIELEKKTEQYDAKKAAKQTYFIMNEMIGNVKQYNADYSEIVGKRPIWDVNSKEIFHIWNSVQRDGLISDENIHMVSNGLGEKTKTLYFECKDNLDRGIVTLKEVNLFRMLATLVGIDEVISVKCPHKKTKNEVEYIDFFDGCQEHLSEHSTLRLKTYDYEEHEPQEGFVDEFMLDDSTEDNIYATQGMYIDMDDLTKRYSEYFSTDSEESIPTY